MPWRRVTKGWVLAQWSSNPATSPYGTTTTTAPGTDSLFLVDPDGGRYLLSSGPSATTGYLQAWSGDGRRAALVRSVNGATSLDVEDLTTGSVVESFPLRQGDTVDFTLPKGLALLDLSTSPKPGGIGVVYTLQRRSLAGDVQATYPSTFAQIGDFSGSYLETPDGSELLMAASGGMEVVRNDGSLVSTLTVPGTVGCRLARWWAVGVALASCSTASTPGTNPRLWEVPLSGAPASALTAATVPPDLGDIDAVSTSNGTFVQALGGCGSVFVAKLQPDGTTLKVTVPGTTGTRSVELLGTDGSRLVVRATLSCGPGISLLWYDPVSNAVAVALGPPVNGGSVSRALAYRSRTP